MADVDQATGKEPKKRTRTQIAKRDKYPTTFVTANGMARNLGISDSTVDKWREREGFPGGRAGPWQLHEVVRWLKLAAEESKPSGESPALERMREEKATMARLDRLEREGRLVDRSQFRGWFLGPVASQLQALGERLQRRYGPGAGEEFAETLENILRTGQEYFTAKNGDDGSDPADVSDGSE